MQCDDVFAGATKVWLFRRGTTGREARGETL